MDNPEAARLLGVAEAEVVDVKAHAGWWHVLHHDMASHEETWKDLPGRPLEAVAVELPEDKVVPAAESETVPDGTAKEVLEWVGDDSDRAVAALDAEEARDQPRSTLVTALEKVVG
jgi:hypothetical protein